MNWSPMSTNAICATRPRISNLEQPAVERERLLDVAHLDRDVVDADQPGSLRHQASLAATPYLAHRAAASQEFARVDQVIV